MDSTAEITDVSNNNWRSGREIETQERFRWIKYEIHEAEQHLKCSLDEETRSYFHRRPHSRRSYLISAVSFPPGREVTATHVGTATITQDVTSAFLLPLLTTCAQMHFSSDICLQPDRANPKNTKACRLSSAARFTPFHRPWCDGSVTWGHKHACTHS